MNNLLSDSFDLSRGDASGYGDIEMGAQAPVNTAELGLESFFEKVQIVEKEMEKPSIILEKLQNANEESKIVTNPSSMKAIKHQMEKDTDEALKVARLEKSKVEELDTELFLDLSVLVQSQGDMLDDIEAEVTKTLDHVNSGVNALQKARFLQKNTCKWMCGAIVILLIIILVIVFSTRYRK